MLERGAIGCRATGCRATGELSALGGLGGFFAGGGLAVRLLPVSERLLPAERVLPPAGCAAAVGGERRAGLPRAAAAACPGLRGTVGGRMPGVH